MALLPCSPFFSRLPVTARKCAFLFRFAGTANPWAALISKKLAHFLIWTIAIIYFKVIDPPYLCSSPEAFRVKSIDHSQLVRSRFRSPGQLRRDFYRPTHVLANLFNGHSGMSGAENHFTRVRIEAQNPKRGYHGRWPPRPANPLSVAILDRLRSLAMSYNPPGEQIFAFHDS